MCKHKWVYCKIWLWLCVHLCVSTLFFFLSSHDSRPYMKSCNLKYTFYADMLQFVCNDKTVHFNTQQQCIVVERMYFYYPTYKIQDQSWRAVQIVNRVYWISMYGEAIAKLYVVWAWREQKWLWKFKIIDRHICMDSNVYVYK